MDSVYKEKYGILKTALEAISSFSGEHANEIDLISILNLESSKLIPCRISSLFVLQQDTFEFKLSGKYSSIKTLEANKIFDDLLNNGIVAKVLMNNKAISTEISSFETAYLFPLKSNNTIYAIQLIICAHKSVFHEDELWMLALVNSIFTSKYFLIINEKKAADKTSSNSELLDQITLLQKGAKSLHTIIDSIHEGIFIVDKRNNLIQDVNQTALKLLSVDKEALLGKNKDEYFLFFDTNIFKDEIITKEEALLINSKGDPISIIHSITEIKIGEYDYQIVSFLDISERKLMEERVQQSRFELEFMVEDRTRELLETNKELESQIEVREKAQQENLKMILAIQQSESLIFITDLNGTIEFANDALCSKTGYEQNELIGSNPSIFKSGDLSKKDYENLWQTISSGNTFVLEFRNRKKNGEYYWITANVSPIKDKTGKIIKYLAVQEDITERKLYEKQLLLAMENVEKAEKAKSSLLANMSHEFKTPLISILGFSELLESELDNDELKEMIFAIKSGGKRLLNSLESVLTLSHLESSDFTYKMREVNLIPLVNKSVLQFKPEAEKKSIDFTFDNSLEEIFISTEENLLVQTLNHLLDNAIKFTKKGSITVTLDYVIEKGLNYVLVKIQDTGIGIAEENQKLIFEAFKQASEGYNRNYEGFGLGLTIAQKTMNLMKGKITVNSTLSEGSTFTVWIPFSLIK